MKCNCDVSNKSKQESAKQRSMDGTKTNLQNAVSVKINIRQKTVNQCPALRQNVIQRIKSQENTSQESVIQGNLPQEKALPSNTTPDSTQLKGTVNQELIRERIELKHKKKKEYTGLQHSDDEDKLKIIEEIVDIIEENEFDENFLKEHSDCSESSIRRVLSAWMGKSISNWTTIFNLTKCLAVNCVFAEHLLALLVDVVIYLVGGGGVVHCRVLSPSKAVIEIDFSKNKSLYKKDEDGKKKGPEGRDGKQMEEKSGERN